jgi:IclR family pca regulon transcriptional regulator
MPGRRRTEPAAAPSADTRGSGRDYVTSFVRGLNVIRALTSAHRSTTLSEVAERTGSNRAATRRFLMTLVSEGYAETNGKKFHLLPKVLELGFSALASFGLTDVAQPVLSDLSDVVRKSCFVSSSTDKPWFMWRSRTLAASWSRRARSVAAPPRTPCCRAGS